MELLMIISLEKKDLNIDLQYICLTKHLLSWLITLQEMFGRIYNYPCTAREALTLFLSHCLKGRLNQSVSKMRGLGWQRNLIYYYEKQEYSD